MEDVIREIAKPGECREAKKGFKKAMLSAVMLAPTGGLLERMRLVGVGQ